MKTDPTEYRIIFINLHTLEFTEGRWWKIKNTKDSHADAADHIADTITYPSIGTAVWDIEANYEQD